MTTVVADGATVAPQPASSEPPPLRVVSIFEAASVIGPLRPLVTFSAHQRQHLGDLRLNHTVVTTCRTGALQSRGMRDLENAVTSAGMQYRPVIERSAFDLRVLGALSRTLDELAPDLVETHNFKSHLFFYLLRRFNRRFAALPWIAFHHGYTQTSWRVRLYQHFDRLTLRHAGKVVTFCLPFVEQLRGQGVPSARVSVLRNTFEIRPAPVRAEIEALRAQLGLAAGTPAVLCVGRLSTEKGQRFLLEAARELRRGPAPGLRVLLVGDGPDTERLRTEFADLGDAVIYLGYQSNPWPYYFAADIVAIPSLSEGSPLVLFEGMAAGIPIVASSVGGIPEVITDGESGMLVAPGDSVLLAQRLGALLGDRQLARRLADGARVASAQYTPEQYGRRLMDIYRMALRDANQRQ